MKAMVWTQYGPPEVLQLMELEKPTPKDHEIGIKIHAATVTAGDCELRRFDIANWVWLPVRLFMGVFKPRIKILGQEFAGEIIAKGKNVTRFNIGDAVFVEPGIHMGGYAQYSCVSDKRNIFAIPTNMNYGAAATIPTGGSNALHFLREGNIHLGQRVLVNGAGGSIGTYTVQIAKSHGAHVTCVDSGIKLATLSAIGADEVIDYTQEDFTQNGQTYDLIIDVAGHSSYSGCVRSLSKNGRYILGNPRISGMLKAQWTNLTTTKKVIFRLANPKASDYKELITLIEAGTLKPVIDKRYPLEELVAAHHYVEKGLKTGNLIITIPHDE